MISLIFGFLSLIYFFVFFRILVYEYVDNGNLEQWLHGDVGPYSPLTWAIRMNVILGTAKGYIVQVNSFSFLLSLPMTVLCLSFRVSWK